MFSLLSVEFAFLFIIFFGLYWFFYQSIKIQNWLLLIFSYIVLYLTAGWMPTLVLFIYSAIIAAFAKLMSASQHYRKFWLLFACLLALLHLSFFKYYNFFAPVISEQLSTHHLDSSLFIINIIFPIGLSYYTFQSISYLVACYQQPPRQTQPLKFADLLLYLSFFASITSGPITRVKNSKYLNAIDGTPANMAADLNVQQPRTILYPKLALALIVLALAKKWWWATALADQWVDPVFNNPMQYHSLEILAAIYGYTLQLYLDFSGYSELVVALALLLGFRLPMNFNAPLLAHNIRDFWNRWHISLSLWIRDYIYIPLGGNRHGWLMTQLILIIAMVFSGVWHGSTANFAVWGFLHGLALVLLNIGDRVYASFSNQDPKHARNGLYQAGWLGKIIGIFVTIHFVVFCFVFFRAKTWHDATNIFAALLHNHHNMTWQTNPLFLLGLMLIAWGLYPIVRRLAKPASAFIQQIPTLLQLVMLFILFIIVVVFAPSGIPNFIYANF